MAIHHMSEFVQQLRRAVLGGQWAALTDGQLLEQFLSRRDPAAIEAIVLRHGAMVWGVCRRILSEPHDAEDAFQATFLVLVRKAASIVPREMVGNWLYGVAQQTARKARAMTAKRRTREKQMAAMPEPAVVDDKCRRDLQDVLDQELARMPDTYRACIVLCDLEGKSRKEAARQKKAEDAARRRQERTERFEAAEKTIREANQQRIAQENAARAKRDNCKKQAKEQNLHLLKRLNFIRSCMEK